MSTASPKRCVNFRICFAVAWRHIVGQVWPHTHAVRKLATLVKKRVDQGDAYPFVFVEMKEFLPAYCVEFLKVPLDQHHDRVPC